MDGDIVVELFIGKSWHNLSYQCFSVRDKPPTCGAACFISQASPCKNPLQILHILSNLAAFSCFIFYSVQMLLPGILRMRHAAYSKCALQQTIRSKSLQEDKRKYSIEIKLRCLLHVDVLQLLTLYSTAVTHTSLKQHRHCLEETQQ